MIVSNLLIGLSAVLWIYFLWSRRKFYLLYMKMRGPLGYPFLGMGLKLAKREDLLVSFWETKQQYGNKYVSWLGPVPFLMIAEPELAEVILTSPEFIDKSFIYKVVDDATGEGLFTADNPLWNTHRKLLNPAFNHKVLLSFFPIFNRESNYLIDDLNKIVGAGEINLTTILQRCALNISAQTTMGAKMTSTNDGKEDLLHQFKLVLATLSDRLFKPWLRIDLLFQMTYAYHPYTKAKLALKDFVGNMITEKLKVPMEPRKDTSVNCEDDIGISKKPNIFIDRAIELLRAGDFTWEEVENESIVIIFGAFETTANTLGNILILLAMFPQYQEKLFEEVSHIVASAESYVTYEDIQQMTYMDMVLNETMRIMSPVPLVARQAMQDFTLPNGVVLPKGLQVGIDIFNMHRDPKYWGPDSTTFNPDNFLPANIASKHPYTFIPFTKGLRKCIGQRYAILSVKIILSKLLRKFRFATKFDFKDLQFVEEITMKLKKYPLLEVSLRDS